MTDRRILTEVLDEIAIVLRRKQRRREDQIRRLAGDGREGLSRAWPRAVRQAGPPCRQSSSLSSSAIIAVCTAAPCSIGTTIAVMAQRQSASISSVHDGDAERIARRMASRTMK